MFARLPLTALRTFEAAARLGSFKTAADELSVTPAAVAHQVKTLEQTYGVLLFERTGQGVRLTDAGEQLQHQVHGALRELLASVQALAPAPDAQALTLTTTAAFASLWLIPRLGISIAATRMFTCGWRPPIRWWTCNAKALSTWRCAR